MAANDITFTITAQDLSTPALEKVRGSIERLHNAGRQLGQGLQGAIPSMTSWERQMARLTTVNGLSYEALTRFNAAVSNLFLGAGIGMVLSSLTGITTRIEEQVRAWFDAEARLEGYRKKLRELHQDNLAETFQARQLDVAFQVEDVLKRINTLTARLTSPNHWSDFKREFQSANDTKALAAARTELQGLIDTYNRLGESIRIVTDNSWVMKQERVTPFETGIVREDTFELFRAAGKTPGQIEEEKGLQILEANQRWWKAYSAQRLAQSTFEIQMAQITADRERAIKQLRLQEDAAALQGQVAMLGTLAGLSASNSRAMFLVGKAAAVAQSLVSAHAAAAMALASPPGPPLTIPLAATVLKWGYANAALAAAVQFATGGFSRGGAPSLGGAGSSSIPSSSQTGGGSPTPQRVTVDITMSNVVFADERSAIMLAHAITPALAKQLQDNDFNLGNIQLTGTRR